MRLLPCPFCGGPPVASVFDPMTHTIMGVDEIKPDAGSVDAHVWCHECGAQGSGADGYVYDRDSYYELEAEAARLWNERSSRNGVLYDPAKAEYPEPLR